MIAAIQNRAGVYAARGEQDRRPARDAHAGNCQRRNQLAGRLLRSRNARVYVYACNACVDSHRPGASATRVSDMNFVAGTAGQEVRMRTGPGENAGAGALAGRPAAAARPGGGGGGLTVQGLPLIKPPYATISAINLDRGEIVWQSAARRNTRRYPQSPRAQRTEDSPHRAGRLSTSGRWLPRTLVIAGDSQVTTAPSEHPRGRHAARVR